MRAVHTQQPANQSLYERCVRARARTAPSCSAGGPTPRPWWDTFRPLIGLTGDSRGGGRAPCRLTRRRRLPLAPAGPTRQVHGSFDAVRSQAEGTGPPVSFTSWRCGQGPPCDRLATGPWAVRVPVGSCKRTVTSRSRRDGDGAGVRLYRCVQQTRRVEVKEDLIP